MYSRLKIEYYKNLLWNMTVSKSRGKSNLAKPILMLSIIQEVQDGNIIGNHITLTESLIETYKTLFTAYAKLPMTSYVYPFYYMKGEDFYHLVGECTRKPPSAKYLRENVEYAALDDELWQLLQAVEAREELREAIISYFIKPNQE